MKNKRILLNIIVLTLSLIAGFVLTEIYMRFAKIEYPIFQTYDFHRGFSLRPNASGVWIREGNAHVKINSKGLRDKEYEHHKRKVGSVQLGSCCTSPWHKTTPSMVPVQALSSYGIFRAKSA